MTDVGGVEKVLAAVNGHARDSTPTPWRVMMYSGLFGDLLEVGRRRLALR
jgi:hypothetical protein